MWPLPSPSKPRTGRTAPQSAKLATQVVNVTVGRPLFTSMANVQLAAAGLLANRCPRASAGILMAIASSQNQTWREIPASSAALVLASARLMQCFSSTIIAISGLTKTAQIACSAFVSVPLERSPIQPSHSATLPGLWDEAYNRRRPFRVDSGS